MDAMDGIADEIGVKPQLIKLFMQDFQLGWKVCIIFKGSSF